MVAQPGPMALPRPLSRAPLMHAFFPWLPEPQHLAKAEHRVLERMAADQECMAVLARWA